MNSKEIIQRTLEFNYPNRVGRSFWDSDLLFVGHKVKTYKTSWEKVDDVRWRSVDEWGNIWGRIDKSSKGEVVKGVLEDLDDLDKYEFPDFSNYEDYKDVVKVKQKNIDKWIVGGMPGFTFNIARKFLKLDKYFIELLVNKEKIKKLHDQIDVVIKDMITNYAKAGVDSIMFPEDWGTQTQTLISPDLWKKEFYQRTKKHCKLAHEKGIKVFMHSCGKIGEIIPGLIDAGIDLLQFDQPTLHGIDNLSAYQKENKITFWCPVDIQTTLQTRNEEKIRSEAKEMIDKLWGKKGGFIAGYYEDNESIGLDEKWQEIACSEFVKQGK